MIDYYPNKPILETGDRVEILREPTQEERKLWKGWVRGMEHIVGETGTIISLQGILYIPWVAYIHIGQDNWYCPKYLLRKV
jgi:hypothetical protein